MYIIIGKADGYIEEKNGFKYLPFVSTDKIKKLFKKVTELWDEIKHLIKTVNGGESGDHGIDFMKIQFNSDDNPPLNKILRLHM